MTDNGTLYLSDLDGTLLDPSACLPDEAARRINRLTARGVKITYATARTVRSVSRILAAVDFTLPGAAPVALMNGVLVRDMRSGAYIGKEAFSRSAAESAARLLTECGAQPFLYTVDDGEVIDGDPLCTYYFELSGDAMRDFMEERIVRYRKPFRQVREIGDIPGEIVYFCVLGGEETVLRAVNRLKTAAPAGIRYTFYRDAYRKDTWYLELFAESASKKHAVEFLRRYTGCSRVVCFGDNHNDLPMFEAADVSVAVSGAVEEAKAAADFITDDVTAFIERDCGML